MAVTIGGLIQDPDSLSYERAANTAASTKELSIDTGNLLIKLTRVGNLTADGVTLQCLYSKFKEIWLSDSNLTPLPFPMNPMTNEQFDMINGWNFDKAINPTTKIVIASCSGSNGATILTTTNNFSDVNVFNGAYVSGGTKIPAGTTVTSFTDNQVVLSSAITQTIATDVLTFWSDVDYTYNLIRNGGWSVKANLNTKITSEEWMGVISLGSLGSEGLTTTTTLSASITNSNLITISDATTSVVGSFITAANVPFGTKISSIISNTQFILTKTISSLVAGSIITIRPKDQTYYQIGANALAAPALSIQTGQMNQPVKIYGNVTNGNIDYRNSSNLAINVMNVYTREQGYTFYAASKQDIGFANLTYQAYRFPLTSVVDTNIGTEDGTISSNGITPTGSPYSNMNITWYATPQARVINGTTRYFNVIIDANTAATSTYSTATAQQIYEFTQWALRRPYTVDINSLPTATKNGSTTRQLLTYSGEILKSIYDVSDGGVYIDHFKLTDINNLQFADNTRAIRSFNYVAQGSLAFNSFQALDGASTKYQLFFNQINQGNVISTGYSKSGSLAFGTRDAVLVKAAAVDTSGDGSYEIKGNLTGNVAAVAFDFAYDSNLQAAWLPNNPYYVGDEYNVYNGTSWGWYRVTSNYTSGATWGGTDTARATAIVNSLGHPAGPTVTLVTVGLTNAQYFKVESTIQKSTINVIASTPIGEKNYFTS
jgi:hypothetical protein